MCRLVLAFGKKQRGGHRLSYSQLAKALRAMPGNNYADLCFRNTVVGRMTVAGAQKTSAELLVDATRK